MTYFCPNCFEEKSLSSQLVKLRPKVSGAAKCDFHPTKKGIPAKDVADLVDGAFRANYGWAEQNPHFVVEAGDSLDGILNELVGPENEEILTAIRTALQESEHYDFSKGGEAFYDESQNFSRYERTLKFSANYSKEL